MRPYDHAADQIVVVQIARLVAQILNDIRCTLLVKSDAVVHRSLVEHRVRYFFSFFGVKLEQFQKKPFTTVSGFLQDDLHIFLRRSFAGD